MVTLSQHARIRLQQRGIPPEAVALIFYFGTVTHCNQGLSFFLRRETYRRLEYLFAGSAEAVPEDIARALCYLMGYTAEAYPTLHIRFRKLLRHKGAKLLDLYFVMGSDGIILTAAYRRGNVHRRG
jgi:hypothetical protein